MSTGQAAVQLSLKPLEVDIRDQLEGTLVRAVTNESGMSDIKRPRTRYCCLSTCATEWDGVVTLRHVYLDFDDTIAEGLSANLQVKAVIERTAQVMQTSTQRLMTRESFKEDGIC